MSESMGKIKTRLIPGGSYWMRYIIPALLFYVVFMAYPLIDSIRMSFYTKSGGVSEFVGFANYIRLFTHEGTRNAYWNAFGNTWQFFFIHLLVQNGLGIVFAVLLTQPKMRGRKVYQTIIFIPTTIAIMVTGYLWKIILNPQWEIFTGVFSFLSQPWLGMENTALTAVSLVSSWQWVGIPTMMFVAALMTISDDLFEAAEIDGATQWQIFLHIKLPLILPIIGIVAVLTFVNNFNAFDVVYSMTGAKGPPAYSTDLIGTLFYRIGIAGEHPVAIPDVGLGSAIASVTFIMLMAVSLTVMRLTRTKE